MNLCFNQDLENLNGHFKVQTITYIHSYMTPVRNFLATMQPQTSSNGNFQVKNYNSPCFLSNSISFLFWEKCCTIYKNRVWTPLSPSKQLSLRWGEGKKEKKPNPWGLELQFYWREALQYRALAPCAVLEHSHFSHLDTGNSRTLSALHFSLPHKTPAWNAASHVEQAKISNSFLAHLITSDCISLNPLWCNPWQPGW